MLYTLIWHSFQLLCLVFAVKEDYLDWEQSGIGRNIIYLLISFVFYTVILFLYESRIVYKVSNLFKGTKSKGKVADLGDMEG